MVKRKTTKPPRKKRVKADEVQGAKYLIPVLDLLRSLRGHADDPKRLLHCDEYCAWLLLFFFTPVLDSMRGLQHASDIATIKRKLKLPRFSLGSFSEAGNVFDPALLIPIIEEVSGRIEDNETNLALRSIGQRPTAVDGTLLRALPKMTWALWRDDEHRAAKLHLHLDLLKGIPESPTLTHAQASEIDTLRARLESGRLYITDRGYFSFDLMAEILAAGSSFVGRVRNNIVAETIAEREVSEEDQRAGIRRDRIVKAGCGAGTQNIDRSLRLVEIHVKGTDSRRRARVDSKSKAYRTRETDHTVMILTDRLDLDVSVLSTLYRYRWQIELFFRWFKKVLTADRLLSLSENGLTMVMYCALLASLLLTLWTGRKPTKRTFETFCFYISGMADDEDLRDHLERLSQNEKTK